MDGRSDRQLDLPHRGPWRRVIGALGPARPAIAGAALALLVLCLADRAESDAAAPEERDAVAVPEPQRRTPLDRRPLIVSLTYSESEIDVDRFPHAVPELVQFLLRDTRIGAPFAALETRAGDPRATGALFLHLTGQRAALGFTAAQRRWLGEYLRDGGLLFAEDVQPLLYGEAYVLGAGRPGSIFDVQVKELARHPQVLGAAGADWRRVPDDHPVFTSLFTFRGAPPPGGTDETEINHLEMLEWRGRAVAFLSELNLSWAWASPHARGRTRALQFGANLAVYALAQRQAGAALRRP